MRPDAELPELAELRARLAELIGWTDKSPGSAQDAVGPERHLGGYTEQLISYRNSEGETVTAYLLRPDGEGPFPAAVAFHQHNGQRHLGKSEVAGHAGDPVQALGPTLARHGFVVLAPDAICFEDRRRNGAGIAPLPGDGDQHYNEMAYRMVSGQLLMQTVLSDAAQAVSVLGGLEYVDPQRIGAVGHSMGGHTTLFTAALDQRLRFACISGALGSYRLRISEQTGLELGQVIPGILKLTDFDGLLALIAPRPTLIVSASEDQYSRDASQLVERATPAFKAHDAEAALTHHHWRGAHDLTSERLDAIIDWLGNL